MAGTLLAVYYARACYIIGVEPSDHLALCNTGRFTTASVAQGITGVTRESLVEDRHIKLPLPAVPSATPDERPTNQCVHNKGHEHRRIG